MSKLALLAAAAACLAGSIGPAAACRTEQMAGVWKCAGRPEACTPGKDIARVMKGDRDTFNYFSYFGTEGRITANDKTVTVDWGNGESMTGVILDQACKRIQWRPDWLDVWTSKY